MRYNLYNPFHSLTSTQQKYREQEKISESSVKGKPKAGNTFVIVDETPSLQKKSKAKRKKLEVEDSTTL